MPNLWKPLQADGKNELVIEPFATPPKDPAPLTGTDLEAPLSALLEKETNLRAVIMLSDGDFNLGQPPVAAAQKMRLRGVPLFPIPVGSKTRHSTAKCAPSHAFAMNPATSAPRNW